MDVFHVIQRGSRLVLGPVIGAVLVLVAPTVAAQSQSNQPAALAGASQGFSLDYGYHSKYQRYGLAYETAPLWSHSFSRSGHIDLSLSMGAGYWQADNRHPDSLWDFALVPTVRWWPGDTYFLEAGVGPTYISRTDFAGKELSTRFQFTTHVGGGMVVNDVHQFGLRWTHVSNAGIKRPNPGLDLIQANYTYRF